MLRIKPDRDSVTVLSLSAAIARNAVSYIAMDKGPLAVSRPGRRIG
jgi:hypothetical protein